MTSAALLSVGPTLANRPRSCGRRLARKKVVDDPTPRAEHPVVGTGVHEVASTARGPECLSVSRWSDRSRRSRCVDDGTCPFRFIQVAAQTIDSAIASIPGSVSSSRLNTRTTPSESSIDINAMDWVPLTDPWWP